MYNAAQEIVPTSPLTPESEPSNWGRLSGCFRTTAFTLWTVVSFFFLPSFSSVPLPSKHSFSPFSQLLLVLTCSWSSLIFFLIPTLPAAFSLPRYFFRTSLTPHCPNVSAVRFPSLHFRYPYGDPVCCSGPPFTRITCLRRDTTPIRLHSLCDAQPRYPLKRLPKTAIRRRREWHPKLIVASKSRSFDFHLDRASLIARIQCFQRATVEFNNPDHLKSRKQNKKGSSPGHWYHSVCRK